LKENHNTAKLMKTSSTVEYGALVLEIFSASKQQNDAKTKNTHTFDGSPKASKSQHGNKGTSPSYEIGCSHFGRYKQGSLRMMEVAVQWSRKMQFWNKQPINQRSNELFQDPTPSRDRAFKSYDVTRLPKSGRINIC